MRPVGWTTLTLAALTPLLAGCAGAGVAGGGGTTAQAPIAPTIPYPGSVRARTASLPSGRDFDFGGGVRVRSRNAPLVEEPEAPLEEARGSGDEAETATLSPRERAQAAPPVDLSAVSSTGVRITWEALAVERELAENPRLGRRPQQGVVPDLKTVLVSEDHPAARGRKKGKASNRERDGSQVAIVGAEEMRLLVKGLREAGFYKVSRPTDALAPLFGDAEARGRVTIEVDGRTATVLSMRGQGQQAATRDVPRIYSQAKQAVAAVRNSTPTLQVSTTGREPMRTAPRRGAATNRTLTEEEAAGVLGTGAGTSPSTGTGLGAVPAGPGAPPDDEWGLGR